ncbi:hypothetical protein SUGI_0000570 [Cryptomeria japonica]|nr:hypothetical protein SUGI_0000570 [Cryptomeria japonica]
MKRRQWQQKQKQVAPMGMRAWYMRPVMSETLAPLMEGLSEYAYDEETQHKKEKSWNLVRAWMREQLERCTLQPLLGYKRSDLRLLLGVLGCPLAPVPLSNAPLPQLSTKDMCIEASSAQYIVHQYIAATGCAKLQNAIKSSYTMGRVKMLATECESESKIMKNSSKGTQTGCFVLWQMMPDMWSVEMVVGGSKVHAASNGKIVWRHTSWLGSHLAKGPVRPLRRALQGLDPISIARLFADGRCIGERRIGEEECFILKLAATASSLAERNDGAAEVIKHVLLGYFSQRTGLLVLIEDSHLTRIQAVGAGAVYWETSIASSIGDYRAVDGVMIAHSGRSVVTLFRFGDVSTAHTKTRMEETWIIEDIVFNVPGLSMDGFIPPADVINASDSCNILHQTSLFLGR